MLRTGFDIKITILNDNDEKPANKLAEAELVFKDGMLEGATLEGFTIWENRTQDGFNVTFPARKSNKGYWDLFRCTSKHARKTITDFILVEFRREFKEAEAREPATGATD